MMRNTDLKMEHSNEFFSMLLVPDAEESRLNSSWSIALQDPTPSPLHRRSSHSQAQHHLLSKQEHCSR